MRRLAGVAAVLALLVISFAHAADDPLVSGFQNPPDSAKPQTWWHWMNGNVTKEGITADLQAMKRVGIGGAEIFVVNESIPPGPAKVLSPQFLELMKHAATEANRLGLELEVHNCAGWSSSGGPWNTPEHAMQFVTSSQTQMTGPAEIEQKLDQPPTAMGFYRDIAVLAFRESADEAGSMARHHPKATTGAPNVDASKLIDGDLTTEVVLPRPETGKPQYVQVELDSPLTVRTVAITPGKGSSDCAGEIEVSDDGSSFRALRTFAIPRNQSGPMYVTSDKPATGRYFRVVFDRAGNRTQRIPLSEIDITPRAMVDSVQEKALYQIDFLDVQTNNTSSEFAIKRDEIVDLTDKLAADGTLKWDVPAGEWTVMRLGYTPTGRTNHPAPPEATGPECDKFSTEALDAHWAGYVQKIVDAVGPLAGKTLKGAVIDSYEVGGQNWTPKMREEFQKRRGYDPTKFLPVMSGRVVESPEASDRFLWDMRRTVSDLFAENYYGHFAELCHQHGMLASIEPYTGPFESLQCGEPADIVMGEFWTGSQGEASIKLAASVAHTYGKTLVGAESFTSRPPQHGRWQETPYSLKALGDLMWSQGINRFIFHRYAMQPWLDRFPGMTMGQWGFHMERTNTWFDQSTAWLKYVTRSQYLLQQGRFVADVAYFDGESAPVVTRAGDPPLPQGFDYDAVDKGVLMKATVKYGRIELPSGMSYAVLVLPPRIDRMTPQFAGKIRDLVKDGALVIGTKPTRSPSLQDYPKCDDEVRTIAQEVWGNCDGNQVTEHAFGKGKVFNGRTLGDVLASASVKPDFEYPAQSRARLVYIHRVAGDNEIYFVSNQHDAYAQADCTFRVTGKTPELWHPESGAIEPAPVYHEADGRTTVSLQFEPSGSVFVIFRKKNAPADHLTSFAQVNAPTTAPASKLDITRAAYEAADGSAKVDVTDDLKAKVQAGIDQLIVSNQTFGGDPARDHAKQLRVEFVARGKTQTSITPEGDALDLSTMADTTTSPTYELRSAMDGHVELLPWAQGVYELNMSNGGKRQIKVDQIAAPVEVSGAWELSFPPNRGAPDKVTLDKLISWTDHSDDGVKYFSGTATYHKTIDISSEMLGADRLLFLDLGRVKNLAQVKLNGKDLGILWKPPFRVDVTDVAKPGANELEIRVTNLWPNRLIGDEKKPADVEWEGTHLAPWPQWLLDGKPSPKGRFTFTTWHHWTAAMKPLESGLIGPVKLQSVQRVKLN